MTYQHVCETMIGRLVENAQESVSCLNLHLAAKQLRRAANVVEELQRHDHYQRFAANLVPTARGPIDRLSA
jgi:hypothetical protein